MTSKAKADLLRGIANHALNLHRAITDLEALATICCAHHNAPFLEAAKAGREFLGALTHAADVVSQFETSDSATPNPEAGPAAT